VIDLEHEIKRELSRIDAPDLWDRIRAKAASDEHPAVVDLPTARHRPRTWLWLATAAAVLIVVVGEIVIIEDGRTVDTTPVTRPDRPTPTTTAPRWSGPELDRGTLVHPMTELPLDEDITDDVGGVPTRAGGGSWLDPLDATVDYADIERVRFLKPTRGGNNGRWSFGLAAMPPPLTELEPGTVITYGVVFDANADGVADYSAGIDTDGPVRGDFRAWVTDLATGEIREQLGPPYGFPVEFRYGIEQPPYEQVLLTFLSRDGRSVPAGLDPATARFYLWTAVTRDGLLIANDYAPDTGWMSAG
jgi:hypothetical protein